MRVYRKLIYLYCAVAFFMSIAAAKFLGQMFGIVIAVMPMIFGIIFISGVFIEQFQLEKMEEEIDRQTKAAALRQVEVDEQMLKFLKEAYSKDKK